MTSPLAQPQTQPQNAAQARTRAIATIAVVLAARVAPDAQIAALLPILARLGIGPENALNAIALVLPHATPISAQASAPVESYVSTQDALFRARYLEAAAKRLEAGGSLEQEKAYAAQHVAAQRGRQVAADAVQAQAQAHGPRLGWYAVLDKATDPVCRAANGHDFEVSSPPKIGLPGAVHPACRCKAGAPHGSKLTVDEALARPHVIPFAVELTERVNGIYA